MRLDALLGPRRDPAQKVGEVEDEHDDLVLNAAGLVPGRGRREALAVRKGSSGLRFDVVKPAGV